MTLEIQKRYKTLTAAKGRMGGSAARTGNIVQKRKTARQYIKQRAVKRKCGHNFAVRTNYTCVHFVLPTDALQQPGKVHLPTFISMRGGSAPPRCHRARIGLRAVFPSSKSCHRARLGLR